jgi:retinol dehydrogenase-12
MQHLGHFLLTNLLLPKLRETAMIEKHPTKVITVSSSLYTNAVRPRRNNNNNSSNNHNEQATKLSNTEPGIDLQDLQCQNKPYRLFEQYAQSKLANILFARELARREKLQQQQHRGDNGGGNGGLVQSHVLHPGLVRTNVTRNMPWYLYYPNLIFSLFMMMLQKSPRCGAYTTVYCAMMEEEETSNDDDEDESCHYFVNSQKQPLEKLALSEEEGRKLWKLSCQLMSLHLEKES